LKKKFKTNPGRQYFQRRFWKSIPFKSYVIVLIAVFFTFSIIGFFSDLLNGGRMPRELLLLHVFLSGFMGVLYFYCGSRYPRLFIPVFIFHLLLIKFIPVQRMEFTINEILKDHLVFDGWGILLALISGYVFFIVFINKVGLRQVRLNAEMSLAKEMHGILVPEIDIRENALEIYGKSLPAEEVGGDLLDVYKNENGLTCYIADVSGHGVASGLLMGMFKSAMHTELQNGSGLSKALVSANKSLYNLKKRSMFLTFAGIRFSGDQTAEYSIAGHLPILFLRAETATISYLDQKQIPLAAQSDYPFSTQKVNYAAGDMFLLLTDGITETANKKNEEFGMRRIERVVLENPAADLKQMFDLILSEAQTYGLQKDDRTMMIIRCG
jgi:serine phosphatase RsbU (regulator of sigma subunit)